MRYKRLIWAIIYIWTVAAVVFIGRLIAGAIWLALQ